MEWNGMFFGDYSIVSQNACKNSYFDPVNWANQAKTTLYAQHTTHNRTVIWIACEIIATTTIKIECDAFMLHNAMLNKMWPCEDDGYSEKMPRATYN